MSRTKLVALVCAVALGGGIYAVVVAADPEAEAGTRKAAAVDPIAWTPGPPPPADPPPPAAAVVAPTPARAAAPAPRRFEPYPSDPAELLRALRPLQEEVEAGLASLDSRRSCQLGGAVLDLSLETGEGEVFIRDAALKALPGESDPAGADHDATATAQEEVTDGPALQCVNEAIKGKTLRAPSARPGRSWRTFYRPGAR